MSDSVPSPGRRFREALKSAPLAIPGVFNALTARLARQAGFRAVYQSGAALSASLAMPDVGLVTLTEFAGHARSLTAAVDIPVLSDADTGFGPPLCVERTVREFETAGLAGLHLEDQELPKRCGHLTGKSLVGPAEMAAKIRAAVAARRDPDFVIIARTDARSVESLEAALDRAALYAEAGADLIFPEALESADEFARFAQKSTVPLLANMTEFGRSPLLSLDELGSMGYAAVLFPVTVFRVAMKAAEQALRELAQAGTQSGMLERMQTRAELYELLEYDRFNQRDRAYFQADRTDNSREP